jgi:molybdopterin-guanine dinucleotide biosynthesis protein B
VEGYKHADIPKLEVWRAANDRPWLHPDDANFIAVASDRAPPGRIRHFPIDNIEAILAFIIEYAQ